jgi:hypothetical protein
MSFRGLQSTPVPYENFYVCRPQDIGTLLLTPQVGPCRSLIFGVSLTDYDFARGEGGDHGRPPTIVEKCISALDQKGESLHLRLRAVADAQGLDAEGLYRISGRKAGVQKMIQDIELDEEKFVFDDSGDVHSVANVLKQCELQESPKL